MEQTGIVSKASSQVHIWFIIIPFTENKGVDVKTEKSTRVAEINRTLPQTPRQTELRYYAVVNQDKDYCRQIFKILLNFLLRNCVEIQIYFQCKVRLG